MDTALCLHLVPERSVHALLSEHRRRRFPDEMVGDLWPNTLRDSAAPPRVFDAMRALIAETGVLKGKARRALHSTVLEDAVARQDTVSILVAQIGRTRRLIPET